MGRTGDVEFAAGPEPQRFVVEGLVFRLYEGGFRLEGNQGTIAGGLGVLV